MDSNSTRVLLDFFMKVNIGLHKELTVYCENVISINKLRGKREVDISIFFMCLSHSQRLIKKDPLGSYLLYVIVFLLLY